MKVLHLSKYYKPFSGGLEQVVADLAEGSQSRNVKTSVLCVSHDASMSRREYINDVEIFRCKSYMHFSSADISFEYINLFRKIVSDFDVIHIHLPNPLANLALLVGDLTGKKVVIHWHSDIVKQKFLVQFYKPLQEWLLKRADSIIVTSPLYASESKYLKSYMDKVVTIPIGISSLQTCNSCYDLSLRERYKNKKVVFALGRLVYYKGFEYLVEAASHLPDDYVVVIGGNGPEKPKLQKLISKHGLKDKVELVGFIHDDDLQNYFKICDVFCLPSVEKSEAYGVVQLEAFSFGKPVVSCSIVGSGVGWVNKHLTSGYVVKPKSAVELADGILSCVSYGFNSSEIINYFQNNFDSSVMVDRTLKTYC